MPIFNSSISPKQPSEAPSENFEIRLVRKNTPKSNLGLYKNLRMMNFNEENKKRVVKAAQGAFGLVGSAILYSLYKNMKVTDIHPVAPISNHTNAFIGFGLSVAAIACLFYAVKGQGNESKRKSHPNESGEEDKSRIKLEERKEHKVKEEASRSRSASESDKEKNERSQSSSRSEAEEIQSNYEDSVIETDSEETDQKIGKNISNTNSEFIEKDEDGFFWPVLEEEAIEEKKYATNHLNMISYSEANHEYYCELSQSYLKFLDTNCDVEKLIDMFPLDALYVLRDLQNPTYNGTLNSPNTLKLTRGEVTGRDIGDYEIILDLFKNYLNEWKMVFQNYPDLEPLIQKRIRQHMYAKKQDDLGAVKKSLDMELLEENWLESKNILSPKKNKNKKIERMSTKKIQTPLKNILINSPKKTNRNEFEQVDLYTSLDEATKNVLNCNASTPKKELKKCLRSVGDIAKGSLEFLESDVNQSEDVCEAFISNAEELELNIQLSTQYLFNSEKIEDENLDLHKTQWTKRSRSHFEFFKYPKNICAQIKNACICMDLLDSEKAFMKWDENKEEIYQKLNKQINEWSTNSSLLEKEDVRKLINKYPFDEILILQQLFKEGKEIKSVLGLDDFPQKLSAFNSEIQGWIKVFKAYPWINLYINQRIKLLDTNSEHYDKTISIIPLYCAPEMKDIISKLSYLQGERWNEKEYQEEYKNSPSKLPYVSSRYKSNFSNSNPKQRLFIENRG